MRTGKQLKMKRIELDIKGKDIAMQLGVSTTYICLMEKGEKNIPSHIYGRWVELLN